MSETTGETMVQALPFLTQTRRVISPYLPPPLLNLMLTIDTHQFTNTYLPDESEPSTFILIVIFGIYFSIHVFNLISYFVGGNSKTLIEGIEDDEPESKVLHNISADEDTKYRDTVIIFGPSSSGKSLLFHKITSANPKNIKTVMSLKANIHIMENGETSEPLRLIDYPGHVTLSSQLPNLLVADKSGKGSTRAVLLVDSTKALSEAGSLLYSVLTNANVVNSWKNSSETLTILVACNKKDSLGSKNWRRVKIQLKNELEKLKKIASSLKQNNVDSEMNDTNSDDSIELIGKNIDLQDLSKNGIDNIQLGFMSLSTREEDGLQELQTFIREGKMLTDTSTILDKRKKI